MQTRKTCFRLSSGNWKCIFSILETWLICIIYEQIAVAQKLTFIVASIRCFRLTWPCKGHACSAQFDYTQWNLMTKNGWRDRLWPKPLLATWRKDWFNFTWDCVIVARTMEIYNPMLARFLDCVWFVMDWKHHPIEHHSVLNMSGLLIKILLFVFDRGVVLVSLFVNAIYSTNTPRFEELSIS